ncbi:MAG: hypothetical protein WCP14_05090 [bacterium]
MDKKLTIITSIVAGVIVIALAAYVGYTMYSGNLSKDDTTNNTSSKKGDVVTTKATDCEALVADDKTGTGKAPYSPVLRSKLNKNATTTKPVCMWSMDGQLLHLSVPVSGSCVFSGVPIHTPGTFKINLEVQDTNCKIDAGVTVTQ